MFVTSAGKRYEGEFREGKRSKDAGNSASNHVVLLVRTSVDNKIKEEM